MSLSPYASVLAACALLYVILLVRHRTIRRRPPFPPGPKKLPIVGNLLDVPLQHPWKALHEMSKEYGSDVIHLSAPGLSIVYLDSAQAVNDLLDKRSSIYSSRPVMIMMKLMGWTEAFPFMEYNETWKAQRKIFQREFGKEEARRFEPQEVKAARELLGRCLDEPEGVLRHIRHLAGSTILALTYGVDVLPTGDPSIMAAERCLDAISLATMPGRFWVDAFPPLARLPDWLPGAGFKRQAKIWRQDMAVMVDEPFQRVKRELADGSARSSVTSRYLNSIDAKDPEERARSEKLIRDLGGSMYVGGADTTVSSFASFFLHMVRHPHLQRTAQAEIDKVLKKGHLPDFNDQESLPFVTAIVKETLRHSPVTPLACPHRSTEDDIYRGWFIPKNSIMLPSIWTLTHDPEVYPDPFAYKPERFLNSDGTLNPEVPDPKNFTFGFGRRICPARYMAWSSLWITVASVLSVFDIMPSLDQDGKEIVPLPKYTNGIVVHPVPFKCRLVPRSEAHEELIRSTVSNLEAVDIF